MSSKNSETPLKDRIDWVTVIVPFLAILALCVCFILMPDASKSVLDTIRFILGDTFGLFYLAVGLFVFLLSLYLAFSRFGTIRLGKPDEKPKYPLFVWASMMFTSGLAADILFYSFCEWILYANDPHIAELGSMQTWSSTYPLFHWGPIPWAFYLVLAVSFGFMLHVRGCHKQKYSEACRALLGNKVDGISGKLIDLLALFALLAGTTTTFALATPLMSQVLTTLFHLPSSKWITIAILAVTCVFYTYALLHGMKGISLLAKSCMYLFFALLAYVLFLGGETRYILETGFGGCRKSCSEFPRPRNLHRPAADHFLSADMDDLLLGLLDGVVRGISVLYRIHLPRKNGAADDPRRICLQRQRYILKLYHFRKLQSRTSGKRKVRRYGDLCRRQRSLHNDHRHHPDTAACTVCPCAFNRCHGGLLCYQL